jgi:hypothetical protein
MPRNIETISSHIGSLGLHTIEEYQNWCVRNGFNNSLNKSGYQLESERQHAQEKYVQELIKQCNRKITLKQVIELIKNKEKVPPHPVYSRIEKLADFILDKDEFLKMASFLEKKTKILDEEKNIDVLVSLMSHQDKWVRSWNTWTPKSYNARKQLSAFIRHLVAKYDVPLFMDSVWNSVYHRKLQEWFIWVAQGQNIIKAPDFLTYYPMTKKMAHFFMQAPDDYSLEEAWRYGQIKSLGGSDRLIETLKWTPLFRQTSNAGKCSWPDTTQNLWIRNDEAEKFFLSLVEFFVKNPMLAMDQVGPIVDYIWDKKYTKKPVELPQGGRELREEQPNFSMAGRAVDTLLNQVEEWHRKLGKEKKIGYHAWDHWNIHDFELTEGSTENKSHKIWRIRQLLTSNELHSEGKAMKHCVASYSHSCSNESSSIWSLTMEDKTNNYRYMTIEVGKSPYRICQVRGLCNRPPTQKETSIINRWASQEKIVPYRSNY